MAGDQFRVQELNPFMEWHLHTSAPSLEVASNEAKRIARMIGRKTRVLVADIGEVLAGHTDARRPGALQTINEVPFLFRHRPLMVNSTSVLLTERRGWSRGKSEECVSGGVERWERTRWIGTKSSLREHFPRKTLALSGL